MTAPSSEGAKTKPSQSPAATALPKGEPRRKERDESLSLTLSVSFADSSPGGRAKEESQGEVGETGEPSLDSCRFFCVRLGELLSYFQYRRKEVNY